jgi:tetratricopeptide (TPR) repeat protein
VECIKKQFYAEALLLLNKAIKEEKSEKELYFNRAECFCRQGDMDFALADYQQALDLDCRSYDPVICSRISDIHYHSAISLFHANNLTEAEQKLDLSLQYNSRAGLSYLLRTKIRILLDNIHGARQDAVAALLLQAGNPEVVTLMARLFPGKTVADVLGSSLAVQTKQKLGNSPHHQQHQHGQTDVTSGKTKVVSAKPRNVIIPDLKDCLEEQKFHLQITNEKRKINELVKKQLRSGGVYSLQTN